MCRLYPNRDRDIGDKRQNNLFRYTVLGFAERSHGDFAILRTSILRNSLAVVDTMDVHLAAAVGAVEKPGQRGSFTPAVRVSPDIGADALDVIIHFLCDDRLMGVLKNRPFAFIDVVAFLVFEVLSGLEIDGMP